jgi:hypothetical protein
LDAGAAWSDIFANDTAGTANGNFTGTRWLVSGGLIGTYPWQMLVLEPSARVFAIWEHENAFTDSLGTFQPARNFETGRASAGVKAIYPFAWTSSTVALSPYAGLYADYCFSKDDAQTAGLTTVPLLQGSSRRAPPVVSRRALPAARRLAPAAKSAASAAPPTSGPGPPAAGFRFDAVVIASEAKQSKFVATTGLLRRCAPRNDELHSRGLHGFASTPPVKGCGAPVVPGNASGRPRKLRTAR